VVGNSDVAQEADLEELVEELDMPAGVLVRLVTVRLGVAALDIG
jgi:hypothetical protein